MDTILTGLLDYGMQGLIIAILLYYLNKLSDTHKDERKEWTDANNRHVEKFANVIERNTQALTEMKGEIKDAKCKV
jgi:hypothetical protein